MVSHRPKIIVEYRHQLSPSPVNRVDIENVNSFLHDPCSPDENELKILTLDIWMTNDVLNQACPITKSVVNIYSNAEII